MLMSLKGRGFHSGHQALGIENMLFREAWESSHTWRTVSQRHSSRQKVYRLLINGDRMVGERFWGKRK